MSLVEVEFVGGPWDGTYRAMPTDDTEAPPQLVLLHGMSGPMLDPDNPPDALIEVYRLRVSPRDDGPLWQYVHAPEEAQRRPFGE